MTKFFYVVDHYVPFPSIEYGGLWNVIAENDDECFDLITGANDLDKMTEFYSNLRANIMKAPKYILSGEYNYNSGIVEQFTT